MNLTTKTVLITGAKQGIGAAILRQAVAAGAHVHAVDRDRNAMQAAVADLDNVTCWQGDVTNAAEIAAIFQQIGAVDGLVNCAGIVAQGSLTVSSEDDLRRTLEVNVIGAASMARHAVALALDAGRKLSIVNIASVISSLRAGKSRFAYGTSKAAVIGMTKSIAMDYVRDGIRCNAICPGTIDTPSMRERIASVAPDFGGLDAAMAAFNNRQPIGHMGSAEEIAALACFLLSDQTSFMTGSIITADGGYGL
ncbi:SDR family NAD(P)-dependent oxidoreductase [Ketogulonicigenium vulgare]|uniref:3-hydroxybutyrate dehydrogenase type 2 n=1 Tax=Ketogulonicigenium vulgare (strain WSH-001) TaxID=759362 RepID=F9Y7Y6_KETVW|nr:SDR family oxidoreductase [Ketogulonicigenium vulgare]ADO42925.1 3-hydroxybutyrate dehydrogenase type 2 [Ketogulonicigenium vulgare Y25]AEM41112.1 3-hydroxybutyrate dehydrogenase type 2 [Ketogulonicigenium vulgare WSH-001]ALJ81252.1 3-hydroxybutyrate dehydrogenase [Ketogulonicigenium vulgare]ANW33993.1 3-hydroxybutyrate dehydrogenase [Ketogulonicigenium vulgare]AOZ54835.1 3-hydroxybutyrate dehydrogenase type 2 [Ketogulonicigenium vulgare]